MSRISKAHMFAAGAHGGVGQKRKYTGEDYINHPIAVREIVAWHGGTVEMQIAALLHDVVEDTHVTIEMVREHFGERVSPLCISGNERRFLEVTDCCLSYGLLPLLHHFSCIASTQIQRLKKLLAL